MGSEMCIRDRYMDLGAIPISFLIKARRIMFLHYLVCLDEEETLNKVYKIQKAEPIKNDWTLQVERDLADLNLKIDDKELKATSKENMKEKVKKACKEAAFSYLKEEQLKVNKKMGKLKYSELCIQEYLKTNEMPNRLKKLTFKLRMKMIKVAKNYGQNKLCPLCKDDEENGQVMDSQEHLLSCVKIKSEVAEVNENVLVKHDDIYGENVYQIKRAAELLEKSIKARKRLTGGTL